MSYATRIDLEQLNGAEEVAQRESMLPDGAVAAALIAADELIDGYLVGRYSVPLNPVPTNLPKIAAQIARYDLLGESATDRARADFKDAIDWLKGVQAGRTQLGSSVVLPGGEPALTVMSVSSTAVFKRGGRP